MCSVSDLPPRVILSRALLSEQIAMRSSKWLADAQFRARSKVAFSSSYEIGSTPFFWSYRRCFDQLGLFPCLPWQRPQPWFRL